MTEKNTPSRLATVDAADLKLLIERLLPFAGTDDTLPDLRCVWFTADRKAKTLTATATDRYVMGRQSVAATPGALRGPVFIDRAQLALVTGWLKLVKTGPVQISATSEKVSFNVVDAVASWSVPRHDGQMPVSAAAVTKLLTPKADARKVWINPKLLRKLPQVPHQFHVGEAMQAVACATDDGLTAIVMPLRGPEPRPVEPAPVRPAKRRAARP